MPRPLYALFLPPLGDSLVVTAQQDFRHRVTTKFTWPSVLRGFQESISCRERVVLVAPLISQYAGYKSHEAVDQDHSRNFSAVQDEIPDGDFVGPQDVDDSLVKTFVSAAQQQVSLGPR